MLNEKLTLLVNRLNQLNKKVASMESCTGGGFANAITNIAGSSEVFEFGAVTYSNNFKVKMGVDSGIIEKYSVYSSQTAKDMSRAIVEFTNADYGIGVTGKLKRYDSNNLFGENDKVFISIFDKNRKTFYNEAIKVTKQTRAENKEFVISTIVDLLFKILNDCNK